MQPQQVEQFILNWHAALADTLTTPSEKLEVQAQPAALLRLLHNQSSLQKLAVNPLLCAMICALYHQAGDGMPTERVTLYRDCVEMLLHRRDLRRKIRMDADYPVLTQAQQLALVKGYAYRLLRMGQSDEAISAVDDYFSYQLEKMNLPDVTGEGVRRFFVERTALLTDPVVGRIAFAHRTFLEYLAAQEVVDAGEVHTLLQHVDDDQWHETIILAAGSQNQAAVDSLIRGLLAIGAAEQRQACLLAVACLETVVILDANLRLEVLENATKLGLPQNEYEVQLFAKGRNAVVPLLQPQITYEAEETAYAVQTLGMIGSATALATISLYAQERYYDDDRYQLLHNAFGLAWSQFEAEHYYHQVLTHVRHLSLDNTQVTDLQPLAQLANLQWLYLQNTQVTDLQPVQGIKNLRIVQ